MPTRILHSTTPIVAVLCGATFSIIVSGEDSPHGRRDLVSGVWNTMPKNGIMELKVRKSQHFLIVLLIGLFSPFPEHAGRVFYFGGFDEVNFRARGDRAWIYAAALPAENQASRP